MKNDEYCKHGHLVAERGGFYIASDGGRVCRECRRLSVVAWQAKYPERARRLSKKMLLKQLFGGNREIVILRDGEKCVACGMTRMEHRKKYGRDITVDHIDGRGRNTKDKNNELDNLRTLCLSCHGKSDIKRRLRRPVLAKPTNSKERNG